MQRYGHQWGVVLINVTVEALWGGAAAAPPQGSSTMMLLCSCF